MRLTENETKVLSVLHMEANAPAAFVEKRTGLPNHTINYCLRSLHERELITRVPFIDLSKLGYMNYGILAAISSEDRKTRDRFRRFLIESPGVSFVSELGGEYQYWFAYETKSMTDVRDFLDSLEPRFGPILVHKAIAARIQFLDFRLSYALGNSCRVKSISWRDEPGSLVLDKQDHQILKAISVADMKSNREVARELGLANSTFESRLRRLRERKILIGYRYLLNTVALGVQHFAILLFTKGSGSQFRERLKQFAFDHPNIRFLVQSIGGWDYELGVETFDSRIMSAVTEDIYEQFGTDLISIKVLPVFQYLKIQLYPF